MATPETNARIGTEAPVRRFRVTVRALIWLALLGPFFFLSYGFANQITSARANVPSLVFGWEHRVPFLPWTIIPYWSSDLLYAISFFACRTRRELDRHARRLLIVQLICVSGFFLFPLRCVFARPQTSGIFGNLFDVLNGFDKPFNQAPSLHVGLAVVLWDCFSARLSGGWRFAMGAWLVFVGLSTMTTWQHQFIDVPTGVLAGCLVIAVVPNKIRQTRRSTSLRLTVFYLSGAAFCTALAVKIGSFGLILLWPAAALLFTAAIYAADWPRVFQKRDGRMHPLVIAIAAPYIAAALINSRWWTRRNPSASEITEGIWLGRTPAWFDRKAQRFGSIIDLCAELPVCRRGAAYANIPMLDLTAPTREQLRDAITATEEFAGQRPTLVCCALGLSRSAAVIAGWLVWTGRAACAGEAFQIIRLRQSGIIVNPATATVIDHLTESGASRAIEL